LPTGRQVLAYVRALWESQVSADATPLSQAQRMKKFMNFIGEGVPPSAEFLHQIRRVTNGADFFRVCQEFLDHDGVMTLEPAALCAETPNSKFQTPEKLQIPNSKADNQHWVPSLQFPQ
jgi:tRNA-dihydrouridine synthase B